MSQHFLRTLLPDGRPVKIQTGWDRPLQGYYLVVERLDASEDADDDEIYLFSNLLHMPRGVSHPKTMLSFVDRLKQIGLALPIPVLAELEDDRVTNAGNKAVIWSGDGDRSEEP